MKEWGRGFLDASLLAKGTSLLHVVLSPLPVNFSGFGGLRAVVGEVLELPCAKLHPENQFQWCLPDKGGLYLAPSILLPGIFGGLAKSSSC